MSVLLEKRANGVAVVTINRPQALNALDVPAKERLGEIWQEITDDAQVRVAILTGAGEKAFCSGLDREEGIQKGYLEGEELPLTIGRVSTPFMYNDIGTQVNPKENDLWKPVIAAVNGMACGGALYMLGDVDIIIAAEHATFFDPHVTYGMVMGFEAVHLLQKLPLGETLRVALLGARERMSAERAHQLGLVSEVVPGPELMERARWVAEAIADAPVLAVQGTLKAIWMSHEVARQQALAQISTWVSLGTKYENIEGGQEEFTQKRREWRLR
jgi:enoyl-CoA hydratase/carnithine racemase